MLTRLKITAFLPSHTALAACQKDFLVNGGFENGQQPWYIQNVDDTSSSAYYSDKAYGPKGSGIVKPYGSSPKAPSGGTNYLQFMLSDSEWEAELTQNLTTKNEFGKVYTISFDYRFISEPAKELHDTEKVIELVFGGTGKSNFRCPSVPPGGGGYSCPSVAPGTGSVVTENMGLYKNIKGNEVGQGWMTAEFTWKADLVLEWIAVGLVLYKNHTAVEVGIDNISFRGPC